MRSVLGGRTDVKAEMHLCEIWKSQTVSDAEGLGEGKGMTEGRLISYLMDMSLSRLWVSGQGGPSVASQSQTQIDD